MIFQVSYPVPCVAKYTLVVKAKGHVVHEIESWPEQDMMLNDNLHSAFLRSEEYVYDSRFFTHGNLASGRILPFSHSRHTRKPPFPNPPW